MAVGSDAACARREFAWAPRSAAAACGWLLAASFLPAGTSLRGGDCSCNAIPDPCEPDCNRNGVPDAHEVAAGLSPDCNGNGLPDGCDQAATFAFGESTTWLEGARLGGIAAADLDGDRAADLVATATWT